MWRTKDKEELILVAHNVLLIYGNSREKIDKLKK